MAESAKRVPDPTFYEVRLEGPPKAAGGLLAGLALGAGLEGRIYDSHEEGIGQEEGLAGRLVDALAHHPREHRAIVEGTLEELLRRLGPDLERRTGLKLAGSERIGSAELPFHYEAFARRYAEQIDRMLGELPAEVRLLDHRRQESVDPDAAGVEAYTPAHEYEIKGEGRLAGRVDLVIAARRALAENPLIRVGRIVLVRD